MEAEINTLKKLNQVIEKQRSKFNITERFSYKFDSKTKRLVLKYSVPHLRKIKGVYKLRKKPKEKYIRSVNADNWKRFFSDKTSLIKDHEVLVKKERVDAEQVQGSGDEYSFKYWMEMFLERKAGETKGLKELSPDTIKQNKRHIGDYYQWCVQWDIKSEYLMNHVDNGWKWFEEYYTQRRDGEWVNPISKKSWSPNTIHIAYRNVRSFYNWVGIRNTIGFPYDGILKKISKQIGGQPKSKRDKLNEHEFKVVMDWIVKNQKDELWGKFILMLRLQFKTGMRIGELCKIRNENIDINNRTIKIVGKSGTRMLYFDEEGDKKMWDIILDKKSDAPWLFYRTRVQFYPKIKKKIEIDIDVNEPTTESYYTSMFAKMRTMLGLRPIITSHSLRRYFVTTFYKNNPNDALIQQIIGHSSRRMVEEYIRTMITEGEKTQIDLPI